MIEVKVSKQEEGLRLLSFTKKILHNASLSLIYKLFRLKDIKVNNKAQKEDFILSEGDLVKFFIKENENSLIKTEKTLLPLDFPYQIIFEDQNILVVNKPKGILVHGEMKENKYSLHQSVLNYLFFKEEYNPHDNGVFIPSPAHRIDFNTSGIVIFGKNTIALQELFLLFKEHQAIEKTYLALVLGRVKEKGKINYKLFKDEKLKRVIVSEKLGLEAETIYEPKEVFSDSSLLKVKIITGRTHQIRVHLFAINHPIIGDDKYGNFEINKTYKKEYKVASQVLHSSEFSFKTIMGPLSYLSNKTFKAPLPEEFLTLLDNLRRK